MMNGTGNMWLTVFRPDRSFKVTVDVGSLWFKIENERRLFLDVFNASKLADQL